LQGIAPLTCGGLGGPYLDEQLASPAEEAEAKQAKMASRLTKLAKTRWTVIWLEKPIWRGIVV